VLARAFFDLPLAEKMRVGQPAPNVSRGYTPLASEVLSSARISTEPAIGPGIIS
jgi:isopenicillin N synthase-like dioxygenase